MRRLHSSAPSVSQLAFEKKTINSNLESVEKGRVEESTALQSVATAQLVSNRKTDTLKANIKIPKGVVSIVITDIEGSTMMWEQNPSAMKDALNVHDSIIRRCYVKQSGYEIATEGDSFRLAFHHPLDALSFCLDCQTKLFNANWTNGILELQNAKHIPDRQMRGLRVRMVVHHGQTTSRTHETTHRIFFKGEGVDIAKALEKVSHGGQIVTNVETWKEVSGLAERHLGSPQILDLGKHDLKGKGNVIHTQRLLQLVPKRLAFDYCTFRGTVEQFTRPEGRTFPPPKTYRQLSTSFFDAPYVENKVCIAFINTVTAREMNTDDLAEESCKLAKMIRSLLIRTKPPAYECQEDNGFWMLAFHSSGSSIMFGLTLIEKLQRSDSPLLVQIGVHCGNFASMGPHTVTGRADYFGPVVNRAARIASHSETGQVRLGIPKPELKDFQSPKIKDVQVRYLGTEMYKGINVKMCLFACIPFSSKESELGIKNGEKTHRRMSLIHDTARCP
jgi:class 3 adenylate cyclase